jgi:hypothetical protein
MAFPFGAEAVPLAAQVFGRACCAAIKMRTRIASLEMLPDTEPLPHLICSRRIFGSGGGDEAAHHGDAR